MKHPTRLYTALPRVGRVRSNSASRSLYSAPTLPLSFFEAPPPPPPNSRPILSTNRLPIEAKGEVEGHATHHPHPPSSLALTAPHAPAAPPSGAQFNSLFFPYPPFATPPLPAPTAAAGSTHATSRRHRARYQLDVGAYGIPKRCRTAIVRRPFHTDAPLAVQVGEDAYFVRDNAMGVADGVGGWARVKHPAPSPASPSASALFARRLMHFCSDEVAQHTRPQCPSSPTYVASSTSKVKSKTKAPDPWLWADTEPEDELADALDELEEGIDVLMILERAYERTLHAHVVPAPSTSTSPPNPNSPLNSANANPRTAPPAPAPPWASPPAEKMIPLLAGSSTALVAVLDYLPPAEAPVSVSAQLHAGGEGTRNAGLDAPLPRTAAPGEPQAVLRIAHIGDCMGMLVRGGAVAWRSEEMWWAFNTPVQVGPCTAPASAFAHSAPSWFSPANPKNKGGDGAGITPRSAAHLFTLPVQADDILILASDGLSDNLWDEDVLDEVVRVARGWGVGANGGVGGGEKGKEGEREAASHDVLRRRTLAGILSEALCSRARRVAGGARSAAKSAVEVEEEDNETPFARRAREQGRVFRGGKHDDISVIVAVISPVDGTVDAVAGS